MMKEFTLVKKLYRNDVRRLCIDRDYYTCGDNDQYAAMFALFDRPLRTGSNITAMRLEAVAEDIKVHSDTTDTVEDILSALAHLIRVEVLYKEEE